MNLRNHWLARYVFALMAVAAAFLVREGLGRLAGGSLPPYITFYPAVLLSALIGGVGPGLFATLVSALVVDYCILPPQGSFTVTSLSDAVSLAFFTGTGVFMSVVAEHYRRARQQSDMSETGSLLRDRREAPARWSRQGVLVNAGLAASLIILAAAGWQSARNLRAVAKADSLETHSRVVIQELERLVSDLKDAETGQRGYLLTGEEKYLEPYQTALGLLESRLAGLKQLARDNPARQQRLAGIETLALQKISELKQTIELRRSRGLPAALEVVTTDYGKKLMDQIRQRVADVQNDENRLLQERDAAKIVEAGRTLQSLLAGGVLAILLLITVFLVLKQENARRARAESDVRHHRDHLQEMVEARTEELSRTNENLEQEIEEHQQAKEALRQQREWLRVTLTSIGDAVLATDTAGRVTFLNPVAEALCGWPEGEVLGKPVREVFRIINEQTGAPGEDIVSRVLRENRIVALANHTALLARDGREIPIEDSAAPIKDGSGTVSGVVLVFHDVTQKRRAQEALRASRERLELALVSSRMATFDWDIVKSTRTWSSGVHRLLGTREETFTGTAEEFFQIMHPEDRNVVRAALARAVEVTGVYETEYRAVWPDRSIHHIAARGRIQRDNAGRAVLMAGVCWDITERKRAQETSARLAAIVEWSDDAIISKDLHGTITSWNLGAERMLGYRAGEIIGRSIKLLLPPERQDEEDLIMARLEAGEHVDHFETARLTKDGRSLAVSVTISPLKDGGGRVIGASKIVRDVTLVKQAQEALRRSEALLRIITDNSPDPIFLKDRDSRILLANPATLAAIGKPAEAVVGKTDQAFYEDPQIGRAIVEADRRVMDSGCVQVVEEVVPGPNGPRVFLSTKSPYHDSEGRVAGLIGISRDITERKQKEEELQKLNRALRALKESSQAVTRATSETNYLDEVCKNVIANCGHAMVWIGFAEGDEARTVRPVAHAGFGQGYLESLNISWGDNERGRGPTGAAIRTGQPCACRNMLTDPAFAPWRAEALKRGYASSLVLPLLAEGKSFGAITIYSQQVDAFSEDEVRLLAQLADDVSNCIRSLRAVSLRERTERRTQLLAEAASSLLSSDDPQRVVGELCRKALEFLDCQLFFNFLAQDKQGLLHLNACAGIAQPEAGKLEWFDYCAAMCGRAARDGCRLVARNIQETPGPGTDLLKPYGIQAYACHPLMIAGRFLGSLSFGSRTRKDFAEEELSFMKTVADLVVTAIERKRVQIALQLTAEEAKQSNHDLEQFAYIASHDLQEPLRAVDGYVKLLQRRFPQYVDAKALEYINGAAEGAGRMERLINDLLAFSRVGTHAGAFSPANLDAILGEALHNLQISIKNAQAKVTHDVLPALDVDATQMMQLFQNLIGNALKFRSESAPEIHVGAKQEPGRWVFSVRDNGIGIEPQYFERIFQIFQRLHTRKYYPGTGIGLAICKKIVERHDGAIWVESSLGQGSTFYFSLPDSSAPKQT